MHDGRRALVAAAAVLVAVGSGTALLGCSVSASPPSGAGATGQTLDSGGTAIAAPAPSASPEASASRGASPIPAASGSLPNLSVENGTTLTVTLFVNGQVVGEFAPHTWTSTIATSALSPLPWIVEARSPSGRVLMSMAVRPGDIQSTVGPSDDVALKFDAGKADLSCGRVRILAGWDRSAPPPYGAIPTPTSSSAGPAPSTAQTPDDCAP